MLDAAPLDPAAAAAADRAVAAEANVHAGLGTPDEARLRVALHEARADAVRHAVRVLPDLSGALDAARAAAMGDHDRVELALLCAVARDAIGDSAAASVLLSAAEARASALENSPLLLAVLVARGRTLLLVGDRVHALRVLHDGIALAAAIGAKAQQAKLLGNLGFLHGDHNAEAYAHYTRQTLDLAREIGDDRVETQAMCNLGGALTQLGQYEDAQTLLVTALGRAEAAAMGETVALAQAGLGGVLCSTGRLDEGLGLYQLSHSYFEAARNTFQITRQRLIIGRHLQQSGRLDEATLWLERCTAADDGVRFRVMIQQAHELLSAIAEANGDCHGALAALRRAQQVGESLVEARVQEQVRLLEVQVAAAEAAREVETERRQNAALREALDEQARLRDELERQMRTDPLTGVSNRRRLTELVEHEIAVGRRCCRPIGLILVDVDHFKAVNDAHGHLVGDAVLVEVARRLTRTVRDHDCVARWGGEEFCVALFGSDQAGAINVARRLVAAVSSPQINTTAGSIAVTISAGVSFYHERDVGIATMLSRADAALYEAKRTGRNRVVAKSEPQDWACEPVDPPARTTARGVATV